MRQANQHDEAVNCGAQTDEFDSLHGEAHGNDVVEQPGARAAQVEQAHRDGDAVAQ